MQAYAAQLQAELLSAAEHRPEQLRFVLERPAPLSTL
jgi:hypothetical protein